MCKDAAIARNIDPIQGIFMPSNACRLPFIKSFVNQINKHF